MKLSELRRQVSDRARPIHTKQTARANRALSHRHANAAKVRIVHARQKNTADLRSAVLKIGRMNLKIYLIRLILFIPLRRLAAFLFLPGDDPVLDRLVGFTGDDVFALELGLVAVGTACDDFVRGGGIDSG